jgi:PAS domain S-box-containing protein
VVLALVQVDELLQSLQSRLSPALRLCIDLASPAAPGAVSCPAPKARDMAAVEPVAWANQDFQLHVRTDKVDLPETGRFAARALAVVGLLSVAMLGALLLTVTGRAHRIQAAVTERTAELLQQIKEREATEAHLRESETRLSNIFNNLPLGVVYTNVEGQLKQVNTRFCELLGYSAPELLEMNALDFTHAEDAVHDDELVSQLVSGRIPVFSRQKRLIRKDGNTVWVQSTVSLLRDLQGRPRRIVAAVEDITEHLRLGEAESAREAAEASNQAKSVFLSRMSHELRTPLNAMLGFAQLLELDTRHRLPDSQRGWVAQIQKAGWHLLDMINDVMDLSRIESGNLRLQEQTLDLFELLAGTLPLIEADAKRRGLTITHDISPEAGRVLGDATRVKQILTNLLTNAVKYNVDGGRIHIASRQRSGMVDVAVTDTGMGLSPEQMAELFQPFNRLGRDRSNIEGTGIGLVISQRLAEWMGGSLRAHSTLGQGSTFTMSLVHVEAPDTVRSDLDEPMATLSTYHRRRVHYVEDNETNVEVMRGILAQRPQIELSVSLTGLDGLAAIRTLRPDVVLLDMHLPDISGMELLRHLRSDAGTAAIPVIVVSADALSAQAAMGLGAQRYLTKPVNVGELLGLLDNILMETDTVFG